ncbi:MAG: patatin-like phospholipase family protein [archaeon]|nr:MAG: patatin-like phospholipase family protein [archaeon]
MVKKKYNLTLVLSGGGARGMCHIGVLKVLDRINIVPDLIVGVSAGAMVGGMYSAGKLYAFEEELTHKTKKQLKRILSFWPSKGGLIQTKKLEKEYRKMLGDIKIEDLPKGFVAGTVDLLSGKRVMLDKGNLVQAILASTAIPIIFPPVHKDDMLLVDGGVDNPLPIDEGFRLAKKVIAVNVTRPVSQIPKKKKYGFMDIFERSMDIIQNHISENALKKYKKNLVVLRPKINMSTLEFDMTKEAIKIGEELTIRKIKEISDLAKK